MTDLNIFTHTFLLLSSILEGEHEVVYETVRTLRKRKEEILQTINWMDHFFESQSIWHFHKEEVILSILEGLGGEAKTISDHTRAEHEEFREMHTRFKRLAENLRVAGLNDLGICKILIKIVEAIQIFSSLPAQSSNLDSLGSETIIEPIK